MSRLTSRQLPEFEAVASNLTFSRAVVEPHLTQPAVLHAFKAFVLAQPGKKARG